MNKPFILDIIVSYNNILANEKNTHFYEFVIYMMYIAQNVQCTVVENHSTLYNYITHISLIYIYARKLYVL